MDALEILETCLPDIKVPSLGDSIYKDECCFSFDNPKSEGGLYICLRTFLGFSHKYVEFYHNVTGCKVFLHMKKIKKIRTVEVQNTTQSPSEKKPKRLAIGIEGGFTPEGEEVEYEEVNTLVILPTFQQISLDAIAEIHSLVLTSISGILSSTSASKKEEILAWDGEIRQVSQHVENLKQLDNGVKIPPSDWKCARCDLTTNLWLNLTDGQIMCGRRYFDGTGGNNHGVEYYKETGYPLAVKLGTITAGGADVHSYAEDMMVEDPKLNEHLTHFGINMMNMEKTEQTMTEMEIDLNSKVGNEWDIIQEAGKKLKELRGPGLTGLQNMGNTCYMNSTLQVLYSLPDFQQRYSDKAKCLEFFRNKLTKLNLNRGHNDSKMSMELQSEIQQMMGDFSLQMCKLGLALFDNEKPNCDVAPNSGESCGPMPCALKRVIGKGHVEFSTNRQQDAHEFLLHVFALLERNERISGFQGNPADTFKFSVEERIECQQSHQVKYTQRPEYAVAIPVPMHLASNKEEVEEYERRKEKNRKDVKFEVGEVIRAKIPFQSCVEMMMVDELISDFWSSAVQEKGEARKRSRFVTFPDVLAIQLKKFVLGDDWIPRKLDVSVSVPDDLDLEQFRARGQQKDEISLPDLDPPVASKQLPLEVDEEAVVMMTQMGFPAARCREALVATGNQGVEAAMTWLMENAAAEPQVNEAPEESVGMLMSMGFSRAQALKALKETDNNLERAADWIFSHPELLTESPNHDDIGDGAAVAMDTNSAASQACRDGPGKYELFAFISHMGTSTMCGHYVCHIKKDGRWVIYNDEKVAESVDPPRDLGYIYFYKRKSSSE